MLCTSPNCTSSPVPIVRSVSADDSMCRGYARRFSLVPNVSGSRPEGCSASTPFQLHFYDVCLGITTRSGMRIKEPELRNSETHLTPQASPDLTPCADIAVKPLQNHAFSSRSANPDRLFGGARRLTEPRSTSATKQVALIRLLECSCSRFAQAPGPCLSRICSAASEPPTPASSTRRVIMSVQSSGAGLGDERRRRIGGRGCLMVPRRLRRYRLRLRASAGARFLLAAKATPIRARW